jgi:hypothetical protein
MSVRRGRAEVAGRNGAPEADVDGISTISATLPTSDAEGFFDIPTAFGAGAKNCLPTGNVRASLAAPTTYFLVALEGYTPAPHLGHTVPSQHGARDSDLHLRHRRANTYGGC